MPLLVLRSASLSATLIVVVQSPPNVVAGVSMKVAVTVHLGPTATVRPLAMVPSRLALVGLLTSVSSLRLSYRLNVSETPEAATASPIVPALRRFVVPRLCSCRVMLPFLS